jgi:hypothetical protein
MVNHCRSTRPGAARRKALRARTRDHLQGLHERSSAQRTRAKRQRRVLHSWACVHLRAGIAATAPLAGVRVVLVDPAYTSQTAPPVPAG